MSHIREISAKIKTTRQLERVMRSMHLMAMVKRRHCIERMQAARPYASAMDRLAHHMAAAHSEFHHPLLARRTGLRTGYLVVTSDRGLCGPLNVRLWITLRTALAEHPETSADDAFAVFGRWGIRFFARRGARMIASTADLGDRPATTMLSGNIHALLSYYLAQRIDRIHLVYNRLENALAMAPEIRQLLPIPPAAEPGMSRTWDYIYEPDSYEMVDQVLRRHIETQVYQAVLENRASEMTARALAMRRATDNAQRNIEKLDQRYHQIRQALITEELEEIMAACEALA